jgi:hypothetical protein
MPVAEMSLHQQRLYIENEPEHTKPGGVQVQSVELFEVVFIMAWF